MYRVVIVDDEPIIRKGLRETVEWDSWGLEVAGEAGNGIQALEVVKNVKPHILITDIKMPEMDGIQLIQAVKELWPEIKIIILSGFSDYAYLKEAIRLGVESYLLKPIDNDELVSNLVDVANNLDQDIFALTQLHQGSELLVSNTLNRLVENHISAEEFDDKATFLKLDLYASQFLCAVCAVGAGVAGKFAKDEQLVLMAIQNICRDLVCKPTQAFIDNKGHVALIFAPPDDMDIYPHVEAVLADVSEHVQRILGVSLVVGVGCVVQSLSEIWTSYNTAASCLDYGIFSEESSIIWHAKAISETQKLPSAILLDEGKLKSLIRKGDRNGLNTYVTNAFQQLAANNVLPVDVVRGYFMQLAVKTIGIFRELNLKTDEVVTQESFRYTELLHLRQLNDFKSWFNSLCDKLFEESKGMLGQGSTIVGHALQYIGAHYNEGITLKQVASHCHINTSYLGQVFKRETGISFTEYVNRYRIEKAKTLLNNPNYKVYEVAEKVGFTDYHYFLKIFKKLTGATPSEIRN